LIKLDHDYNFFLFYLLFK